MAIAFDASSSLVGTATTDFNWTHTPVGTPRGVLVIIIQNVGTTDEVIGVTYGGVAMSEVALSPFHWTASIEDATIYGYWLGSSVPTGAQTIAVDVDATGSAKKAAAITVTAANDTIIEDTDTDSSTSGSNPTASLVVTRETVCLGGMHTGNAVLSAVSAGAGFTEIVEVDWGAQVSAWQRSTATHSAANYSCGWTSTGGTSQACLAIAMAESGAVIEPVAQASETDVAQPVAWSPKHRLANQALSTELAQAIAPASPDQIPVAQAVETDLAQPIEAVREIDVAQALETDLAQAVGHSRAVTVAQANETDSAQVVAPIFPVVIGQASETDVAFGITPFSSMEQATELDRAQQVTVLGGVSVVSDAPVLIRAPRKAGRIFHEIVGPSGEGYHPSVAEWEAEEDAPGGFRGAKGLISSRVFHAHRDAFRPGAMWRTFLEDGTCIFAGRLKESDPDGTVVQLSAHGRAIIADREVGPILYQAHVGSELSHLYSDTERWRVEFPTMSHSNVDTGVLFNRTGGVTTSGQANVIIPFFGRELAYLRMHMQGQRGFLSVGTRQRTRVPSSDKSAELDLTGTGFENYYFHFGTPITAENVEIDLVQASGALPSPNTTVFTNEGPIATTGWGFIWPDCITIEVSDHGTTPDVDAEILLSNIEVNGSPLGRSRRYSVGDLVEDIAARLGFRDVNAGGSYDITPYELPPGVPASEALDWACLVSGKRYRILDTGTRATFEFGPWNENIWALASPWSPLRTIPEERFDAVAVPYQYPGTHGQLTDQVIVRVEDSPLLRRRVAWDFDISQPAHNQDKARDLGAEIADDLVRPRFTGDFSAAEVMGPDGERLSAHHVNAGDVLQPWRRGEPGRLRIGRLIRFDDHVEGEFDGENRALNKLVARREKRLGDRDR